MIDIPQKITRELLLEHNSEETYLSRYVGIQPTRGMFRSPFRKDNHPSCSFWRSPEGKLYFKDFSRNELTCDFVKAAMIRYGISDYHEALKVIAEDFGIIKMRNNREVVISEVKVIPDYVFKRNSQTDIRVKIYDSFSERHLEYWGRYGIDEKILRKYRVYPIESLFINGKFIDIKNKLCFGYFYSYTITDEGKRLEYWRIYFPGQKKMRFVSSWKQNMIQGWKQLAERGNIVVITKSMKDVMCMSLFGINAVAPCSESTFVSDEMLSELKARFNHIVVMYDNDKAGLCSMAKIRRNHPELTFVWIPKKFGCKDFSDMYEMYGRNEMNNIIKEARIMVNDRIKKNACKQKQFEIIKRIFGTSNENQLISSEE